VLTQVSLPAVINLMLVALTASAVAEGECVSTSSPSCAEGVRTMRSWIPVGREQTAGFGRQRPCADSLRAGAGCAGLRSVCRLPF